SRTATTILGAVLMPSLEKNPRSLLPNTADAKGRADLSHTFSSVGRRQTVCYALLASMTHHRRAGARCAACAVAFSAASACGEHRAAPPAEGGTDTRACTSSTRSDGRAAMRASCSFAAGAMPTDTLDVSAAEQRAIPIRHVIVLMKENRSYDEYFGELAYRG